MHNRCRECEELDGRIQQRHLAKQEATVQFTNFMQGQESVERLPRNDLAAKVHEAEIELRVLYEVQVLHEFLAHGPT